MRIHTFERNVTMVLESTEDNLLTEYADIIERLRQNRVPFQILDLGEPEHHKTKYLWQVVFPAAFEEKVQALFPTPEEEKVVEEVGIADVA